VLISSLMCCVRLAVHSCGHFALSCRRNPPPPGLPTRVGPHACARMTELQHAASAVQARLAASGGRDSGKQLQLLSSREFDCLLAVWRTNEQPDGPLLIQLAQQTAEPLKRVRKFFENQRATKNRKRKAMAPSEREPSGDNDDNTNLQLAASSSVAEVPHAVQEMRRESHLACRCALRLLEGDAAAADPEPADHSGRSLSVAEREQLEDPVASVASAAALATLAAAEPSASARRMAAISTAPEFAAGASAAAALATDPPSDGELVATLQRFLSRASEGDAVVAASSGLSQTRLELFSAWMRQRRMDPFSCAWRCGSALAELVELYGRANITAMLVASSCVLQCAFVHCELPQPLSLRDWQERLADVNSAAKVCRRSDMLWVQVRKDGPRFSDSAPTKAREDTLTAIALVGAIAPHHARMYDLVSAHAQLSQLLCAQLRASSAVD